MRGVGAPPSTGVTGHGCLNVTGENVRRLHRSLLSSTWGLGWEPGSRILQKLKAGSYHRTIIKEVCNFIRSTTILWVTPYVERDTVRESILRKGLRRGRRILRSARHLLLSEPPGCQGDNCRQSPGPGQGRTPCWECDHPDTWDTLPRCR